MHHTELTPGFETFRSNEIYALNVFTSLLNVSFCFSFSFFFLRNSSHHSLISLPLLFFSFFFFEITLVFTTISVNLPNLVNAIPWKKKSKCPFSCSIVKIIKYTLALVIHSLSFCISLLVNIILQDSDCSIFFFRKMRQKMYPRKINCDMP